MAGGLGAGCPTTIGILVYACGYTEGNIEGGEEKVELRYIVHGDARAAASQAPSRPDGTVPARITQHNLHL